MNHIMTFTEILHLEKPRTVEPLMEQKIVQRKVSRLLSRSFTLNLKEPQGENPGIRFVVKIHGDRKYVQRHLLWKLIFQGVQPLEWFILYREFEIQIKEDPSSLKTKYLGILLLLSNNTRKRLPNWKSTSRSVFKILKQCLALSSNSPRINLLEDVLFELKIPKKGDNVENIFSLFTQNFFNKKPIPVNRIGVGYKDKGSLKQGYDEVPEPLQPYEPDSSIDIREFLEEIVKLISREYEISPLRL